jgi:hypothetical protein
MGKRIHCDEDHNTRQPSPRQCASRWLPSKRLSVARYAERPYMWRVVRFGRYDVQEGGGRHLARRKHLTCHPHKAQHLE